MILNSVLMSLEVGREHAQTVRARLPLFGIEVRLKQLFCLLFPIEILEHDCNSHTLPSMPLTLQLILSCRFFAATLLVSTTATTSSNAVFSKPVTNQVPTMPAAKRLLTVP